MSRLSIGSFNVLNLKTDTKSGRNAEFKAEKVSRIAAIIDRRQFDIVCLQEVQSDDTVQQIVDKLNRGGCTYAFAHCASIYEDLAGSYPFKSGVKGELAFIWNTCRVRLDEDKVVYKGIHDRLLRAIDQFVTTATVAIAGLVTGAVAASAKRDGKTDRDDDSSKNGTEKRMLPAMGVAGLAVGAGSVGHLRLREEIEGVLKNTIRPPLVGLFRLVDGGTGENTQIRVVNVHSQFAKTKYDKVGGVEIRKIEAAFVSGDIFEIVDSERNGSFDTVHTIVAGDFNLVAKNVSQVLSSVNAKVRDVERHRKFAQRELTTVALVNGDAVNTGKEPPRYERRHDYDHFVFRTSCWDDASATLVREDDLFFIGRKGDSNYRPISDHYPVEILTDKV